MRSLTAIAAAAVLAMLAAAPATQASEPPTSVGRGGAAATVDRVATQAAIDTLRRGGNATDAAVTAAAVLGVTEPFSCGIGGGGLMVAYDARAREVTTLDHRERAPLAMGPDAFFENGAPLPALNDARYSGLSVGVPGTVRGWARALRLHGTISLAQALAPAIRVARDGFVVDETFAAQTQENLDYFDDVPAAAALYLDPDGTPRDVGTVFRNPDLARTYALIARRGPRGFYRGPLAEAIVQTVRNPPLSASANHRFRPGVMDAADLRDYTAPERPPVHTTYRGLDVFGMGPPSSGGSTVGEALNILEGYPLGAMPREEALHYELEASRFAFADRGAYVADPDFYDVPLAGLLSKGFADSRRALIGPSAATSPVAPGDPSAFGGTGAAGGGGGGGGGGEGDGGGGGGEASVTSTRVGTTTHITVADRRGDVVSYTFTIESTGGSGLVVPGYGFLLNNELTDFNYTSTTHPNRVEGGKRPRSSMAPTIVLRDGRPWLGLGSPGGSTIITTVLGLLVDRVALGSTLPAAIAAPRASERNTSATTAEPAFIASPEGDALRARGHAFTVAPPASGAPEIGAATGIEFLDEHGLLAAAEPTRRGGGSALVVRPDGP
jgi:gamma-glutamyltranspeptidase/glutathione hydrolase